MKTKNNILIVTCTIAALFFLFMACKDPMFGVLVAGFTIVGLYFADVEYNIF